MFGNRKRAELIPFNASERRKLMGELVGGSAGHTEVFARCREMNVSRMDAWTSEECK